MNIKKIIKEELEDDWSWVQEYPNIWLSYQLLLFDETPTKGEVIKFINDALNSGLVSSRAIDTWRDEGVENESEIIYNDALRGESPYLRIDLNDGWLYYGQGYQWVVNNYPELRKINFSEAKNYTINESENDPFNWIRDQELTIPQSEEDLKQFIGWSFLYETSPNHSGDWHGEGSLWRILKIKDDTVFYESLFKDESNSRGVIDFLELLNEGTWVLVSPEGTLFDPIYNRSYGKNINESEDEWDWVREIPGDMGLNSIPRVGDVLICLPGFEGYEGHHADPNNGGSGYVNGRIIVVDRITETKSEFPGRELVIWPDENESRKYWDNYMPCFDCGIYGMALTYYFQPLTESTGFEWIDDITPEDIKIKIGDTIKVKNIGDEASFINWLGDYSSSYNHGEYGTNITGEVVSVGKETFRLSELSTRDGISFPNPDKIKKFRVDHKDLDLSYEILNKDY